MFEALHSGERGQPGKKVELGVWKEELKGVEQNETKERGLSDQLMKK